MQKQWYDHKTQLCTVCHWYKPSGEQATACGKVWFPEGCAAGGISFHDYGELADDCEKYISKQEWERQEKQRELLKKKRK